MASRHNGTLYIGVTNDLIRRVHEHKTNFSKGFTYKYKIYRLVYFEECNDIAVAIQREKRLKKWPRQWKIDLIVKENPGWKDLYEDLIN